MKVTNLVEIMDTFQCCSQFFPYTQPKKEIVLELHAFYFEEKSLVGSASFISGTSYPLVLGIVEVSWLA